MKARDESSLEKPEMAGDMRSISDVSDGEHVYVYASLCKGVRVRVGGEWELRKEWEKNQKYAQSSREISHGSSQDGLWDWSSLPLFAQTRPIESQSTPIHTYSRNITEQLDMVEVVSRAFDVVISVVNDVLDAAKLDAHKLTLMNRIFDLWALVEKIVTMFGERVGARKLELIVLYDPETLSRYVKADPERLQQVIMNLLSNAIKFTDNGEIMIKVSIKNKYLILVS
ncbi:451_t:CDS:2, partial [Paraglomus brasilianum]